MEFAIVLGLDIAAAAIIIYCMCAAARKGFLRTVVQMIAYVVIIFVASTVSRSVAPVIYDHFVEPMIMNPSGASSGAAREVSSSSGSTDEVMKNADLVALSESAGSAGYTEVARMIVVETPVAVRMSELSDTEEIAKSLLSDTASTAGSMIDDAIGSLDEMLGENASADDFVGEIVGEIADAALRPLITNGITMVAFVVIFALLSIVANIVLGMLGIINHLPVIGKLNSLLGGAVGILQGLLIVWVLALLLRGLLNIYPDGVWKITQEIVDSTHLFKYFANPGLISGF